MYKIDGRLKLVLIMSFLLMISACENKTQKQYPFNDSGFIMGTSFSIKATQLPVGLTVEQLKEKVKIRLDGINQRMSTYLKDSELSLLNRLKSTQAQPISPELLDVLLAAEKISQLSKGAFDITVAPLVNLWGFGPDRMRYQAPKAEIIQEVLAKTGYTQLVIDEQNTAIAKKIPELSLDLSALAKGYAVDEVALVLEEYGLSNYLVEIGGEIRLKGVNLQGKRWRIAIEKPVINRRELERVIAISNIAMATSGDYRNFFESEGQRFSHTIDPRTGYPITHKLASVTVLSHSTMVADAWATALMVLGPEAAYDIAEQQSLAAFFIIKTDQGFTERETALFTRYTKDKK